MLRESLRSGPVIRSRPLLLRALCVALLVCLTLEEAAGAQAGAQPSWPTYQSAPRSSPREAPSLHRLQLPPSLGLTRQTYLTDSDRTLIHIEDAHDSMDAQDQITSILDVLASDYDVRTIALEGGSAAFDGTLWRTFPDPAGARRVAKTLLERGQLSAGEFFAATSDKNLDVYGAEEETLYRADLKTFEDLLEIRERSAQALAGVDKTLSMLAERVYGKETLAVRAVCAEGGDNKLAFTARWKALKSAAARLGLTVSAYPQLERLDSVTALEAEIDFAAANTQRERLLEVFRNHLTGGEREQVLLRSLNFKAGKITESEFHLYLTNLAHRQGLDPVAYSDLARYTEYLVLFDTIDLAGLLTELSEYEQALLEQSLSGGDDRRLWRLERTWSIVSAMLRAEATSQEVGALAAADLRDTLRTFGSDLSDLAAAHRVPLFGGGPPRDLDRAMAVARRFYRLAERRNEALVANTLRRMREKDVKAAALVTGGYHSEGISRLLRERQLSHLVILPRIADPNKKRPYVVVLTRKPAEYARRLSSETGRYQIAIGSVFTAGRNSPLATDSRLRRVLEPFVDELRRAPDPADRLNRWTEALDRLSAGAKSDSRLRRIGVILRKMFPTKSVAGGAGRDETAKPALPAARLALDRPTVRVNAVTLEEFRDLLRKGALDDLLFDRAYKMRAYGTPAPTQELRRTLLEYDAGNAAHRMILETMKTGLERKLDEALESAASDSGQASASLVYVMRDARQVQRGLIGYSIVVPVAAADAGSGYAFPSEYWPRAAESSSISSAYDRIPYQGPGREAMIVDLLIHPAYRGRSLGVKLRQRLLQQLARQGVSVVRGQTWYPPFLDSRLMGYPVYVRDTLRYPGFNKPFYRYAIVLDANASLAEDLRGLPVFSMSEARGRGVTTGARLAAPGMIRVSVNGTPLEVPARGILSYNPDRPINYRQLLHLVARSPLLTGYASGLSIESEDVYIERDEPVRGGRPGEVSTEFYVLSRSTEVRLSDKTIDTGEGEVALNERTSFMEVRDGDIITIERRKGRKPRERSVDLREYDRFEFVEQDGSYAVRVKSSGARLAISDFSQRGGRLHAVHRRLRDEMLAPYLTESGVPAADAEVVANTLVRARQGPDRADAFVADARAWVKANRRTVQGRRNAWSILAAYGLDGADAVVTAGQAWVSAHQAGVGGPRNAWDIFIKQGADSATVWVAARRFSAEKRIEGGASPARAWFLEITNLTQLTGARLSALTERKSGHVVVLDRDARAPVMRVLPVVRASDLTRPERTAAFERFYDWFDDDPSSVTHGADIEYYLQALERNDPAVLTRLFLVWSDAGIEGYADLGSEGRDFSGIEIAPWNRRALGEEGRFGGVGAELRMFAIRRLESEWGADVLYGPKIHHVFTLGHRDSGGDVFDYATVDQAAVRAEMGRQAQVRKSLIREYGYGTSAGARLAEAAAPVTREPTYRSQSVMGRAEMSLFTLTHAALSAGGLWAFVAVVLPLAVAASPLATTLVWTAYVLTEVWHWSDVAQWLAMRRAVLTDRTIPPGLRYAMATTYVPASEPLDLLERKVRAMLEAVPAPYDIYVLDEGDDAEVKAVLARLDPTGLRVHHFSRKGRPEYNTDPDGTRYTRFQGKQKAGNVNAWLDDLKQRGVEYDVISVTDLDQIPEPDFLTKTLPYFKDPSISYVQGPEAHFNRNDSFITRAGSQNVKGFFGLTERGYFGLGLPFIVGSAVTLRAEDVYAVGGFQVHPAEDFLLSLVMTATGRKGVYTDEILTQSETPPTFEAFVKRERRWAWSTLNLLFYYFPQLWSSYGWSQRFFYLKSLLYYLRGTRSAATRAGLYGLLLAGVAVQPTAALAIFAMGVLPTALALLWGSRYYVQGEQKNYFVANALVGVFLAPSYFMALFQGLSRKPVPFQVTAKKPQTGKGPALLSPALRPQLAWLSADISVFAAATALYGSQALNLIAYPLVAAILVYTYLLVNTRRLEMSPEARAPSVPVSERLGLALRWAATPVAAGLLLAMMLVTAPPAGRPVAERADVAQVLPAAAPAPLPGYEEGYVFKGEVVTEKGAVAFSIRRSQDGIYFNHGFNESYFEIVGDTETIPETYRWNFFYMTTVASYNPETGVARPVPGVFVRIESPMRPATNIHKLDEMIALTQQLKRLDPTDPGVDEALDFLRKARDVQERRTRDRRFDEIARPATTTGARLAEGPILAVNLTDFGIEYTEEGQPTGSYRGLDKVRPLLGQWKEAGITELYLYGGLYPPSQLSINVHQVSHPREHFLPSGRSIVRVDGYNTRRDSIGSSLAPIKIADTYGNPFSIYNMLEFNESLSEQRMPEAFEDFVRSAQDEGFKIITDFIPWRSPDSITNDNYKRYFWRPVKEEEVASVREKVGAGDDPMPLIKEILRLDVAKSSFLYLQDIQENGHPTDKGLLLIKHLRFFNDHSADQAIPNALHPAVQEQMIADFKRLIDMGVYEFRVDLGHLLLKKHLLSYYEELRLQGVDLLLWLKESGIEYGSSANFEDWYSRQEEPWGAVIARVREYADEKKVGWPSKFSGDEFKGEQTVDGLYRAMENLIRAAGSDTAAATDADKIRAINNVLSDKNLHNLLSDDQKQIPLSGDLVRALDELDTTNPNLEVIKKTNRQLIETIFSHESPKTQVKPIRFIMETYDESDQNQMKALGADAMYSNRLFNALYEFFNPPYNHISTIKEALNDIFNRRADRVTFLSNFDQISLKRMGCPPEVAAVLIAMLSRWRVRVLLDWRDWLYESGQVATIPGGASDPKDRHTHSRVDEADLMQRRRGLSGDSRKSPMQDVFGEFERFMSDETPVKFLNNSNCDRYLAPAWRTQTGDWVVALMDFRPTPGEQASVKVELPGPETGFDPDAYRALDPVTQEALSVTSWNPRDPSSPRTVEVRLGSEPSGQQSYKLILLKRKEPNALTPAARLAAVEYVSSGVRLRKEFAAVSLELAGDELDAYTHFLWVTDKGRRRTLLRGTRRQHGERVFYDYTVPLGLKEAFYQGIAFKKVEIQGKNDEDLRRWLEKTDLARSGDYHTIEQANDSPGQAQAQRVLPPFALLVLPPHSTLYRLFQDLAQNLKNRGPGMDKHPAVDALFLDYAMHNTPDSFHDADATYLIRLLLRAYGLFVKNDDVNQTTESSGYPEKVEEEDPNAVLNSRNHANPWQEALHEGSSEFGINEFNGSQYTVNGLYQAMKQHVNGIKELGPDATDDAKLEVINGILGTQNLRDSLSDEKKNISLPFFLTEMFNILDHDAPDPDAINKVNKLLIQVVFLHESPKNLHDSLKHATAIPGFWMLAGIGGINALIDSLSRPAVMETVRLQIQEDIRSRAANEQRDPADKLREAIKNLLDLNSPRYKKLIFGENDSVLESMDEEKQTPQLVLYRKAINNLATQIKNYRHALNMTGEFMRYDEFRVGEFAINAVRQHLTTRLNAVDELVIAELRRKQYTGSLNEVPEKDIVDVFNLIKDRYCELDRTDLTQETLEVLIQNYGPRIGNSHFMKNVSEEDRKFLNERLESAGPLPPAVPSPTTEREQAVIEGYMSKIDELRGELEHLAGSLRNLYNVNLEYRLDEKNEGARARLTSIAQQYDADVKLFSKIVSQIQELESKCSFAIKTFYTPGTPTPQDITEILQNITGSMRTHREDSSDASSSGDGARLAENPVVVVGVPDQPTQQFVLEALDARIRHRVQVLIVDGNGDPSTVLQQLENTGAAVVLNHDGPMDPNGGAKMEFLNALSKYLEEADLAAYPLLGKLLSGELELSQVPPDERAGIERIIFSLLPDIHQARIEDRLAERGEQTLLELQLRLFHPSVGYQLDHLSGCTEPRAAVWSLETIAADPFFFRMLDDRDRKNADRMTIVDYAAVPSGVDAQTVLGERHAEFKARFGPKRVLTDDGSAGSVSAALSDASSEEFGVAFSPERTLFIETKPPSGLRGAVEREGRQMPHLVVQGRIAPLLDKVVDEILARAGSDQPLGVPGLTRNGDLYTYIPIAPEGFMRRFKRYYQMVGQIAAAA